MFRLLQPVFECPGFKYWIPRLAGSQSFTIEELNGNKLDISLNDTVRAK